MANGSWSGSAPLCSRKPSCNYVVSCIYNVNLYIAYVQLTMAILECNLQSSTYIPIVVSLESQTLMLESTRWMPGFPTQVFL